MQRFRLISFPALALLAFERTSLRGRRATSRFIGRTEAARTVALAVLVAGAAATSACNRYWVCEAAEDATTSLPARLSETGLFADIAGDRVGPDVLSFRPAFELWSDGAAKRRWIFLPAGTRIDTSDMDDWSFPRGTKIWKEFSKDGVRVETRLLQKIGDGDRDWAAIAYVWTSDGRDAFSAPWGTLDALGTSHDVPAAGECAGCHGGRRSHVLGFSAVQLAGTPSGGIDLAELARRGLLSRPPERAPLVPGGDAERAALGYLHANCSHCHNQARPSSGSGARCFDPKNSLDFQLLVDRLATSAETPAYRTAVGGVVKPGDPEGSRLFRLVARSAMPPLAASVVDDTGVAILRTWIEQLPR